MRARTFLGAALLPVLLIAVPARGEAPGTDLFAEMQQQLNLRFHDALTGDPISGATVTFEGTARPTDANGMASFDWPSVPESGEVTLVATFEKQGYVPTQIDVRFMLGTVWRNRFSISPALPPGKLRIVLDWEATPPDLDAHLVKDGAYHISYRQMRRYEDEVVLDRDDTDGHGPETITIDRLDPAGHYTYYVHDYTHGRGSGGALTRASRAHVSVFGSGRLVQQFDVPRTGGGVTWKVFEISGGAIVPATGLSTTAP